MSQVFEVWGLKSVSWILQASESRSCCQRPFALAASLLTSWLYQFARAAVTNHHKLAGLQQQKCVLSEFWRLEV